jgi:hypothetical protein
MSMGCKGLANDTLCVQTRRHSRGVVESWTVHACSSVKTIKPKSCEVSRTQKHWNKRSRAGCIPSSTKEEMP